MKKLVTNPYTIFFNPYSSITLELMFRVSRDLFTLGFAKAREITLTKHGEKSFFRLLSLSPGN